MTLNNRRRNRRLKTLEILMAAHDNMKEQKRWCQGSLARNEARDPVSYNDASAVSFCVLGFVYKVATDIKGLGQRSLMDAIMNLM